MKQKIFIDSDIILDLLAEREKFYDDAAEIFTLAYEREIELYTTAIVLANVFYIFRKIKGNEEAKRKIKKLRLLIRVLPINENIVDLALNSSFTDFEDGLQYFTSKEHSVFTIITRNIGDYKMDDMDMAICTSEEFLRSF
ncbi:MAG: type II toxin-antitoxin system VapC family toxin [Fibromonadaceae bacterium]|jgi:predicted nucleic acid-binding protein|nr:type II toxin-antitoxin system VapC family toxin [Fibromonadaceae bacterium]